MDEGTGTADNGGGDPLTPEPGPALLRILRDERRRAAGRIGSFQLDLAAGSARWSPAMCRLHGVEPDRFEGTVDAALGRVDPRERAEVERSWRRQADGGEPEVVEYRVASAAAGDLGRRMHLHAVTDETGRRLVAGTVEDLGDDESARLLAEARTVLDAVTRAVTDDWFVVDLATGRLVASGPGEPAADLAVPVAAALAGPRYASVREQLRSLGDDDVAHTELRVEDSAGVERRLEVRHVALSRDPDGKVRLALGAARSLGPADHPGSARRNLVALGAVLAGEPPDLVFIDDLTEDRTVAATRPLAAILGYAPADLPEAATAALARLVHPEDLSRVMDARREVRVAGDGDVVTVDYRAVTAADETRWLHSALTPFARDDRAVTHLLGTVEDRTDRRRPGAELRDHTGFAAALELATPDVVVVYDVADDRSVYCSAGLHQFLGYATEEVEAMGDEWLARTVHPDDLATVLNAHQQMRQLADGEVLTLEWRMRHGSGAWRWISGRHTVFARGSNGTATQLLAACRDVTTLRQADEALGQTEQRLHLLAEHATDVVSRHTPDGVYRYVSGSSKRVLGRAPDEMVGSHFTDFVHPDDVPQALTHFRNLLAGRADDVLISIRMLRKDGTWCWVEVAVRRVSDPTSGELTELVVVCRDVTAWVEALRTVAASEQRFRQAFDAAPVGIAVTAADGRLRHANRALFRILGRSESTLHEIGLDGVLRDPDQPELLASRRSLLTGETELQQRERRFMTGDGEERWGLFTSSRFVLEDGEVGILTHIEDITPRKETEAELVHAALHDALTDLPNRSFVMERIRSALSRAERHGRRVAVLFYDLDNLKRVNDTLGHAAGDELLITVARRVDEIIADTDYTTGRLSGDEFVVLCEDVDESQEVLELADRLSESMRVPMTLGDTEVVVTMSLGVAFSEPGMSAEDLLLEADTAMYKAKQRGRARWVLAEPTVQAAAQRQVQLEADLRRALQNGDLVLHFQPVVDAAELIVGAEALLRWQHSESGLRFPGSFLDAAESSDLIVDIGEWVLHAACQEAVRWQRELPERLLTVSCNVAARQLGHGRFADTVSEALAASGLEPKRLVVEITETQLVDAVQPILAELADHRAAGVGVAVDDFGSASAPLSHIRNLPAQLVKIDRSFIKGVVSDPTDAAMVEAVINLAHATGCGVVAKGVETRAQWDRLLDLGCDRGQGYLFHHPMPGVNFRALVERPGPDRIAIRSPDLVP